jgi:hypothetical protein
MRVEAIDQVDRVDIDAEHVRQRRSGNGGHRERAQHGDRRNGERMPTKTMYCQRERRRRR